MFWNIEGTSSPAKLTAEIDNFDIILLVETMSTDLDIPNFVCLNIPAVKQSRGRPFGGITACIHQRNTNTMIELYRDTYTLCTRVGKINLQILTSYFPPNTDIEDIIISITEAMKATIPSQDTIIIGDYNCRVDKQSERGKAL